MELIKKIKLIIKEKDQELYSKIMDANISDDEILFKANIILQYLNNKNIDNDYERFLEIENNQINEVIIPVSTNVKQKEILKEFKKNFLYGYNSNDMYFWDADKIDWNLNGRKKIFDWAMNYNAEKKRQFVFLNNGLWIWGSQGTGKTAAIVTILNMFADSKISIAFVPMSDFVIKMQNAAVKEGVYTDELLNPIKEAKILVFDDIGAEKMTEWVRDALLVNILDYRINNNLLTIFTSNINLKQYFNKIDFGNGKKNIEAIRVIDRIRELAPTEIHIYGNSFRGKLKKQDLLISIKK